MFVCLFQTRKRSLPINSIETSSDDVSCEGVTSEAEHAVSRRTRSRSDVARPLRDEEEGGRKDVGQKLMTQAKTLMVNRQVRRVC